MAKSNWGKWGRDFIDSVVRHVATAGLTAATTCYIDGRLDWRKFGSALLIGGVIPSVFTFLQKSPIPDAIVLVVPQLPPSDKP